MMNPLKRLRYQLHAKRSRAHPQFSGLLHRDVGASLLSGQGLDIGALHAPQHVPAPCTVAYLDVDSAETLRRVFPELKDCTLIEPHYVGDIAKQSIVDITRRRFDFIILNHVLEHVANPIQVLKNTWDGLETNGRLMVAVPDKNFTFDCPRPLTTFAHLTAEYFRQVSEVSDDHYVEFLEYIYPGVFADQALFLQALQSVRDRREHAHIWDSATFRSFLQTTFHLLGYTAKFVYESLAAENHFEYCAVIQKGCQDEGRWDLSVMTLATLYRARLDLQAAFPITQERFLSQIVHWACTAGATVDAAAAILAPYQANYRALVDSVEQKDQQEYKELLSVFSL